MVLFVIKKYMLITLLKINRLKVLSAAMVWHKSGPSENFIGINMFTVGGTGLIFYLESLSIKKTGK